MTPAEAEHIARILEQFQDVFGFAAAAFLPNAAATPVGDIITQLNVRNPYGGVVFGFTALALVYSFEAVAKPLNFPPSIVGEIKLGDLAIVQNNLGSGESAEVACFRHLRKCFAHGRYSVAVAGNTTTVVMRDFNPQGNQTFEASCEAQVVGGMAERILIAAHAEAASVALPPNPAPAAAP